MAVFYLAVAVNGIYYSGVEKKTVPFFTISFFPVQLMDVSTSLNKKEKLIMNKFIIINSLVRINFCLFLLNYFCIL